MRDARPGDLFAKRYRLRHPLGSGGMGVVFDGTDELLNRPIAVKILHAEVAARRDARKRFAREAKVAASFAHANAIQIFDYGEQDTRPYLVMERLYGLDLAKKIHFESRLSIATVLEIGRLIAEVLASAHEQELIHRDIKPDNVFIEQSDRRVVVLDFGMAFIRETADPTVGRLTTEGLSGGTPAYMAPEQCGGAETSGATDVYALGCVLFEALVGMPPFNEQVATKYFIRHLYETPERLGNLRADVPRALDELVARMLAKRTDDRPTAQAVCDRLVAIQDSGLSVRDRGRDLSYLAGRSARAIPRATPAIPDRAHPQCTIEIRSPIDKELQLGLAAVGIDAEFSQQQPAGRKTRASALYLIEPDLETVAHAVAENAGRPVLVGTHDATIAQIKSLLRIGVADVVTRPRSAAQLATKLRRLLKRAPTQDES